MRHILYTIYRYTIYYILCLDYTIQHCTTLRYTTLPYTTLHYTTLHYTTLHYTTLHYTTLHCSLTATQFGIVSSSRPSARSYEETPPRSGAERRRRSRRKRVHVLKTSGSGPRFPLKGPFKGDIDAGIDIDVDMENGKRFRYSRTLIARGARSFENLRSRQQSSPVFLQKKYLDPNSMQERASFQMSRQFGGA